MVPSANVAFRPFKKTFWPPRSDSPSGIPQARMESEIRQIRPGKSLKAARTAAGWTWMPSEISSAITFSLSAQAAMGPGSR